MLKKNLIIAFSLCFLLCLTGFAQTKKLGGGIDMTGEIDRAPYRLVVPESWNGTLLIYGHGFRDKADHPGEVDNRNPDVVPNAALEPILLGQGYALAGSAFKDNGWAVAEGFEDSKNLIEFFNTTVGQPNRTLYWGFSMGSVIGFKSAETTNVYDGVLCGCGLGGGSSTTWDGAGDLLLAYDVIFGNLASWGTPGDIRDNIDFETEVLPKIGIELANPANFPAFEFMRLVVGIPGRGITPPPPPDFFPNWVATDMFFTTEARSELERRAGGPVVQNLDRSYDLTPGERVYLNGLGVPTPQIDAWLAAMNLQRVHSAPQSSRDYLRANADYTGQIRVPVLTLHTKVDPLVTVTGEFNYAQTIIRAGRPNPFITDRNTPGGILRPNPLFRRTDMLFQTYTDGNGHCNFTGEQLVTAINVLNNWVATKIRPTEADFPTALGFDNDFSPPPPNQP